MRCTVQVVGAARARASTRRGGEIRPKEYQEAWKGGMSVTGPFLAITVLRLAPGGHHLGMPRRERVQGSSAFPHLRIGNAGRRRCATSPGTPRNKLSPVHGARSRPARIHLTERKRARIASARVFLAILQSNSPIRVL